MYYLITFEHIFICCLGIGRAVAESLASSGVKTYAVSRTQDSLDKLKKEVNL